MRGPVDWMCYKHIESDPKLCLKTHQVVFKRLNSQFMVACTESWLKKQNTARKHKQTNKNSKQTNKKPKPKTQRSPFPPKS